MNYSGRYGKHYEIPNDIKKYCFSENGDKLLSTEGLLFFKIKNPILLNEAEDLFCVKFEKAIHEMEANIGTICSYRKLYLNGDEFSFQILDPIALLLEKMNIPLKEAAIINDSHCFRSKRNVGQLLQNYYDLDTAVEIYSKDDELFLKDQAKNILLLNSLCNCEIADYFDDCYSDHSISITPKGLIKTEVYDEIDKKRQFMQ